MPVANAISTKQAVWRWDNSVLNCRRERTPFSSGCRRVHTRLEPLRKQRVTDNIEIVPPMRIDHLNLVGSVQQIIGKMLHVLKRRPNQRPEDLFGNDLSLRSNYERGSTQRSWRADSPS